jgi:hypothetical protein
MIRQNTPQASLRTTRKAPFATRGLVGKSTAANESGAKTSSRRDEIALTPEQEHICDRATD